jgi:hypothetical protein
MGNETKFTGGCHCGAIRYEADQPPIWTGFCHCRTCQRVYGNAFGLWSTFYPKNFSITEGKPKTYKSSDRAEVGFCENCGTPLTFRFLEQVIKSNKNLDFIGITVGSLDNPENVKPVSHNHVDRKLSWLSIEDGLPQHASARVIDN